ncbi:hypothetical protein Bca4012_102354 [Brassica carinata]
MNLSSSFFIYIIYISVPPYEFMDHYFPRDSQPDIGRKARDLLFEDFPPVCSKFRLDKHPFSAYLTHQNDLLAISPNDIFLGEGRFSWSVKSVTNEFTIRTNSTLAFNSTINQIAFGVLPGLSAVSEFDTAIANSGKVLSVWRMVLADITKWKLLSQSFLTLFQPFLELILKDERNEKGHVS